MNKKFIVCCLLLQAATAISMEVAVSKGQKNVEKRIEKFHERDQNPCSKVAMGLLVFTFVVPPAYQIMYGQK